MSQCISSDHDLAADLIIVVVFQTGISSSFQVPLTILSLCSSDALFLLLHTVAFLGERRSR
jgi:hypothetical protein